jgi:alcohol dehydrogenase class IV
MTKVALYTDPRVAKMAAAAIAEKSLCDAGIAVSVHDKVVVEPTDSSFKAAIRFAEGGDFDGFVSVGGGSVIDTCKAANLYATHPPADFLDYINAPVGKGLPIPGPLRPHIACPTTFGTASECTGIAVCDMLDLELKTGIISPRLRPTLGVLDPASLATLPRQVVAANGFDVFSHAVESFTARPYTRRPAPAQPTARPMSQGANPYSDIASLESIRLVGENLVRAVADPADIEAMEPLMFAGMLAGIGFGNAGCHVPHGMSYAVAGLVESYHAEGWPGGEAMVPHGISVIVNAPAVFRRMGPACPDRHMRAAEALGVDTRNLPAERAGHVLADKVIALMKETGMPNGVGAIGYSESDLDALTERSVAQKRLLDNAPAPVGRAEIKELFRDALRYW